MIAAVLGVVSKETVATLPAAVLLYWLCFLRGARAASPRRRLVLVALLLLPLAYALLLARSYLMPAGGTVDPTAGPRVVALHSHRRLRRRGHQSAGSTCSPSSA